MKQVLQSLRTGAIELVDVPASKPAAGTVLIRTRKTLISSGTERMLIEFGRANWLPRRASNRTRFARFLRDCEWRACQPRLRASKPSWIGRLRSDILMRA